MIPMEKFMRKMWKKSEGFTLVELIVVIAILGILAAVAVPAYSGYMTKAKESADMQVLSSVATAVAGVAAGHGVTDAGSTVVTKTAGEAGAATNITFGSNMTAYSQEVYALLDITGPSGLSFKGDWKTATLSGDQWTLAYN